MAQKRKNEVREKGERLYRKLRSKLEPKLNGKVLMIDVNSGLYVLGDDVYEAHKTFKHFIHGPGVMGYGRTIGPDPYTVTVSA